MTIQDVAAAQPAFSDEELETLFHKLGIMGDPRNEADRAQLMGVLRDVAEDLDHVEDLVAALHADRPRTLAQPTMVAHEAFTPIRRRRVENANASVLADVPSVGKELGNAAVEAASLGARTNKPAIEGGILRGYVPQLEGAESDRSPAKTFIVDASRALPARQPSSLWRFVVRLVDALKGEAAEGTWHTIENGVDVQLKHGPRRWDVSFVFLKKTVVLTVASDNHDVIKREVATTRPEEFSTTLLDALDGDVRSTQLALDAAQRGMTTDSFRTMH